MRGHRVRLAALVAFVLASSLFLMGDFCSDVLGFPVLIKNAQTVDLQVDMASLVAGMPQARNAPVPAPEDADGDIDLDAELPGDIDLDVDPAEVLEDLGDLLEDIDWEELDLPTGSVPDCATATPDPLSPGTGCLCLGSHEGRPSVVIRAGCLLGHIGIDLVNLSPEVKNVAKFVDGIFVRDIRYSVMARDLTLPLPGVRMEVLAIESLGENGLPTTVFACGAEPEGEPCFDRNEGFPDAVLGIVPDGALPAGRFNETLLAGGRCDDEATVTEINDLVWGAACDPARSVPCDLTCPAAAPVEIPVAVRDAATGAFESNVDRIAAILESLRFAVRALTPADLPLARDLPGLVQELQAHPGSVRFAVKLGLRFEIAVIVVPPV